MNDSSFGDLLFEPFGSPVRNGRVNFQSSWRKARMAMRCEGQHQHATHRRHGTPCCVFGSESAHLTPHTSHAKAKKKHRLLAWLLSDNQSARRLHMYGEIINDARCPLLAACTMYFLLTKMYIIVGWTRQFLYCRLPSKRVKEGCWLPTNAAVVLIFNVEVWRSSPFLPSMIPIPSHRSSNVGWWVVRGRHEQIHRAV